MATPTSAALLQRLERRNWINRGYWNASRGCLKGKFLEPLIRPSCSMPPVRWPTPLAAEADCLSVSRRFCSGAVARCPCSAHINGWGSHPRHRWRRWGKGSRACSSLQLLRVRGASAGRLQSKRWQGSCWPAARLFLAGTRPVCHHRGSAAGLDCRTGAVPEHDR